MTFEEEIEAERKRKQQPQPPKVTYRPKCSVCGSPEIKRQWAPAILGVILFFASIATFNANPLAGLFLLVSTMGTLLKVNRFSCRDCGHGWD